MSDLFRPNIARLRGYVPGEQPREKSYIKLNTNENPYPPSPLVLARLRQACAADLRLYPDPDELLAVLEDLVTTSLALEAVPYSQEKLLTR